MERGKVALGQHKWEQTAAAGMERQKFKRFPELIKVHTTPFRSCCVTSGAASQRVVPQGLGAKHSVVWGWLLAAHGSAETRHLHTARQQLEVCNRYLQGGIFLQGICLAACFTRFTCSSKQTYWKTPDSCGELTGVRVCQVFVYYRVSSELLPLPIENTEMLSTSGAQKAHLHVSPEPYTAPAQGLEVQQDLWTHLLLNSFFNHHNHVKLHLSFTSCTQYVFF